VLAEGAPEPVRVRASWVDDGEIRRVAAFYRPPLVGDVIDPTPTDRPGGWVPDIDGQEADRAA
jgi:S-DNA-T family DNA segregation ATPase FtsK/SpoIIIE